MLGLALTLTLAAPPSPALLARLGAAAFGDREQAGRELLGHGPDALHALADAARSHPDPEVRRRAAALADQVARSAETAARTAVTPVRLDFHNTPLAAAVAELRLRTGIPLQLAADVASPDRPVTVRGDLAPWEAVESLCRAAKLRERVQAEVLLAPMPGEPLGSLRRRTPSVGAYHPDAPANVSLILADGPAGLPGDRSGGVRVQAVPADFPGHKIVRGVGEVHLCLDVSPLPVLAGGGRWEEVTGIKVGRAEDDRGRPVTAAHRDAPEPEVRTEWLVLGGGLAVPGLLAPPFGDLHARPATRPNPRLVTLPLRVGDRPARTLAVLEGTVLGEVTLPNQPLAVVEDLPRAAGLGAHGTGDVRLTVLRLATGPDGRTTIKVRVDTPNQWTFPRANRVANFGLFPGFAPSLLGPAGSPAAAYRFTDAAGRPLAPSGVAVGTLLDDGLRQSGELEFQFDREPARLVLVGEKTVAVEVPFRLRDVPLP